MRSSPATASSRKAETSGDRDASRDAGTGAATGRAEERRFLERLRAALPDPDSGRFAVAYSGGLDSTVLLAAAARLIEPGRLRALHVDHALHPSSADWANLCAERCARVGVPFESVRVRVDRRAGTGLEAAARSARYAALGERLAPGEALLTAHHADDQLETLLLRLFRGSGVRGLRGILPGGRLGAGEVARPLLGFTRAELHAVARRWKLDWIEDPANFSLDLDRNLVRAKIAPVVRERWGDAAAHAAERLAAAMRDAERVLEQSAREDLAAAGAEPGRVPLAPLRELDPARQRNVLRLAIRVSALPMPSAARLEALREGIGATPERAARRVEWRGGEARLFRDRFYLLAPERRSVGDEGGFSPLGAADARPPDAPPVLPERSTSLAPPAPMAPSAPSAPSALPGPSAECTPSVPPAGATPATGRVTAEAPWEGIGRLVLEPIDEGARGEDRPARVRGFPASWGRDGFDVRFRAGGERFKPDGDAHHRTLKAWLLRRGVVPWMRHRIPLLYREGRLVAVADLVLDEHACRARPNEPRWRVRWIDHPRID